MHIVPPAGSMASLALKPYLETVPARRKIDETAKLIGEWPLSPAATLGSSVRARGLFLEVRARLPGALKKLLHIESRVLTLRIPEGDDADVRTASTIVSKAMQDIEHLPVIPREVEDILTIKQSERHRWLRDGRLQSAGTRTVKLRGRARKISFHVFNPRHIEDVLDRDLVTVWREEDAATAAANRRRAAGKAAMRRAQKTPPGTKPTAKDGSGREPIGWDEFESEGLLQ